VVECWQDQRRSGGTARNQHPKRLPHLADTQRCRESGHADSDPSASQRIIEGAADTAASAAICRIAPLTFRSPLLPRANSSAEQTVDRLDGNPKVTFCVQGVVSPLLANI
jgi:hypothetical protein